MEFLLDPNVWIAFAMLTALEIVLGVDNIIFISILVGRLPPELRDKARRLGLAFAMLSRLALLFSLSWVMGLTADLFTVFGQGISGRDLVLLLGGLFLLYKASHEIFLEVEAGEEHGPGAAEDGGARKAAFWGVIGQIAIIDIVFSLDSVITAVGMVDQIAVMVGMVLTAEAFDKHVPKGYIYAAMAFSLAVEALNIRARGKRTAARALKARAEAGKAR